MSFDWRQYFQLARYMSEHASDYPDEEACYRTVVSRAYYAVYRLARDYVYNADGKDIDVHQVLQKYLKQNRNNKLRYRIGNQLKDLHQLRKKADYESDLRTLPVNIAKQAMSYAQRILDNLDELVAN
jgi:uncharacterized protein (UPF0332 family)